MNELNGKVALVTGAGRGIGQAAALELARRGARVVLLARTDSEIRAVAQQITQTGGQAVAHACDISRLESLQAALGGAQAVLGPVDVLVNNAGVIGPLMPAAEVDAQDWTQVIEVNLLGTFYATRLVLPGMLERGWGRIINVSSGAAQNPFPHGSAYSVSKAGMDMLTRSLAREVEQHGVSVVGVYPGVVDTRMQAQLRAAPPEQFGAEASQRFRGFHERGELLDPALPARLIAVLAGPAGTAYNGQLLRVTEEPARTLLAAAD